jgi:polysaccharide pyruvyl transferase CsaB
MSERRVFLVGWYGVDNVGDDAIRLAVERAAPRFGAEVPIYSTRWPVEDPRAVSWRTDGWRRHIQAIRSCDRVALGGGGLLKDEGGSLGYSVLLELLATAVLARLMRKQVVLLAMGVGPLLTRRGRWLTAAVARLTWVRQVRDEDSARLLRDLGVRRVEVTVDPTFTLLADPPPPDPSSNGHAVLSVRPWFVYQADREQREGALQGTLARAADTLAEAGSEPRFANLYWPRDREAADAVIGRMSAADASRSLDGPLDWDELVAELRDARVVVAMRYHAIVCAALAGRPVVPIAYEPKVVALAQALGLPYLHVDDPDFDRRLPELTRAALANPPAHRPDRVRLEELSRSAWAGLERVLGP